MTAPLNTAELWEPARNCPRLFLFPNPVTDQVIKLRLTGQASGEYVIYAANIYGNIVMVRHVVYDGTEADSTIVLDRNMPNGAYFFAIIGPQLEVTRFKIIVAQWV